MLVPLIIATLALLYSRNQSVVYEARATLLVKQGAGSFDLTGTNFAISNRLASTYQRIVVTTPFLEQVVKKSDTPYSVGKLKSMISASRSNEPPILEIRARNNDPRVAAQVAELVAVNFIDYVIEQRLAEIARLQSAAAAQGIVNVQELVSAQLTAVDSLTLLEPVSPPDRPVLPRTRQNVMLGVIIGIILAAGLALLLESLGDTVRNPEEITRRMGVSTLGSVFRWTTQDADERELVLWKNPTSNYAESFRQIRANLQFATSNRPGNLYLFCSPGPGEGKSTIICNMAIALANAGKSVIVIDGDLRRATVHKRFDNTNKEPGLSNYLADFTSDLGSIIQTSEVKGVSLIASGPTPPNPAELLGLPKMASMMTHLRGQYDYVLIDSAPVLLVADGSIIAAQADGAVIIVDGPHTRMSSLQATLNTLKNTHVEILGVVINKIKRSRFGLGYGYGYSHYYSGYGYYGNSGSEEEALIWNRKVQNLPSYWIRILFSKYRSRRI